jgi:hypothetical protein
VFVTERFAIAWTLVVSLALSLLESESPAVVAVAVSTMAEPSATLESTCTERLKFAVAPADIAPDIVHVTVPVAPTAGVLQTQPPGALNETNVVPAGSVSVSVVVAVVALVPSFSTWMS